MELKRLPVTVKAIDDLGEGVIEAVVASDHQDRHGEILDLKGLDLAAYKRNPVVLWAHKHDSPPIGQTLSIRRDGSYLKAKIKFAIEEDEFAHKIYRLFKGGYMRAFSIGFIPLEMEGNRYIKSEMIEHSAVPVPANADALALAVSRGILDKSDIKNLGLEADERKTVMELKEILAKRPEDLTAEERAFLIEEKDSLSKAQKIVFKDVLPAEEVAPKEEPAKEEDKKEDDGSKDEDKETLEEEVEKLKAMMSKIVVRKDINAGNKVLGQREPSKEEKTKLWFKGLITRNWGDYINAVGKDATTMDSSDTSAVLPPEEFIAEVSRLEEEYGIAARYANVRRTSNPTLRGIKGGDDVEFVKTDELGLKSKQKVSYDPYNLSHLEYTGIVPMSDTLLEDSAIDLFRDVTQRFARAAAKREDELVFTENDTTDDVYGILEASGTYQLSVGADIDAFDGSAGSDILNQMMYGVPTPSASRGRFYLHRTVLGRIQRMKDDEGRYIWAPGIDGGVSGTIWGMPYSLTEVLPSLSDIEEGDPFMLFGDLKNTTMSIRVPMQTQFFDTGVITDASGNVLLNLMQQDAQVIRARLRMNQVHVHPEAYSVLVAGSLS